MALPTTRVGVDIGGTFTDIALDVNGVLSTCKVLTNYAEPEQAILDGIEKAVSTAGIDIGEIGQVIHGTTLVTNALIERRGAKLAFITTDGFRDVVEMRSENRFEQYDLNLVLPRPLAPRKDRYVLKERIAADGSVLLHIDDDALAEIVQRIITEGYEAVAVGLMHSYANGAHERRVAQAFRRAAPDLPISLSAIISPQMREYARFNTVIANAYVQPRVSDYLGRLVRGLIEAGVTAPVFMMHSGGGLIDVKTAAEQPVRLLESGPAGGAIFAAEFAASHQHHRILSFDMGGTTAKICLVEDGEPKTAGTFEVARTYRFKKGSGMIVATPVVEMVEIGAGGGSIAHLDRMNQIRVGPKSAGSEPGPACYNRGGALPTVTDANLVLGRLDADNFAGGAIPLSVQKSVDALKSEISDKTNLDASACAFGVTEMVDENMANAARVHALENGRDIEKFTMVAFGGGAPLHACRLCEKLGIKSLIIPSGAGVGSAIGFLKAPFSYQSTKGLFQRLDEFNPEAVNATIAEMEQEAGAFVRKGAGDAPTHTRLAANMRYCGQGSEILVAMHKFQKFVDADAAMLKAAFEDQYRTLFGRTIDGLPIEITNWSLGVASVRAAPETVRCILSGALIPSQKRRAFFDAALRKNVDAIEIERRDIKPGLMVAGPAVVVEDETTTIVTSQYFVVGQPDGSLLLQHKDLQA